MFISIFLKLRWDAVSSNKWAFSRCCNTGSLTHSMSGSCNCSWRWCVDAVTERCLPSHHPRSLGEPEPETPKRPPTGVPMIPRLIGQTRPRMTRDSPRENQDQPWHSLAFPASPGEWKIQSQPCWSVASPDLQFSNQPRPKKSPPEGTTRTSHDKALLIVISQLIFKIDTVVYAKDALSKRAKIITFREI